MGLFKKLKESLDSAREQMKQELEKSLPNSKNTQTRETRGRERPKESSNEKATTEDSGMFSARLEMLINSALKDGVLTESERAIILKRAIAEGEDPDEVSMILDARLEAVQAEKGIVTSSAPNASASEPTPEPKLLAKKVFEYDPDLCEEKSIVIPEGVTEIAENAFRCSKLLESVIMPSTLVKIGARAFQSCYKLTKVDWSRCRQLETIGEEAFCGAIGLKNIVFPPSLKEIESSAFGGCENLKSLDFGNCSHLVYIGDSAFSSTGLTEIVIPDSVKSIGDDAFSGNGNLSMVTIGRSLKNYGSKIIFYSL